MQYKDTTLIIHPKGGYGKIMLWCLNYFSGHFEKNASIPLWIRQHPYGKMNHTAAASRTVSPTFHPGTIVFMADDNIGLDFLGTMEYLQSNKEFLFGSTTLEMWHQTPCHSSYINDYKLCFKKIVHLILDPSCHLLILHNKLKKRKTNGYQQFFDRIVDRCKEPFGAHEPVPTWQLREMISFEHDSSLIDDYQPVVDDQVINVPVRQLVHNFQNTIVDILQRLKLPIAHNDQFDRIKNEWLCHEQFINTDLICQDIVTRTLLGQNFSWKSTDLTVIDEAFVQYQLRNKNFEMRCHGLDTFPTNSVQLKELLYSV